MAVEGLILGEAAKTVVGSTIGYFIGKFFGKKEHQNRCSFLWELEMEVSPRLLPKLIDREVKEGCIKPEDADDRLKKILDVRQKYGILGGYNVFGVSSSTTEVSVVQNGVSKTPPSPPNPEKEAKKELLQHIAMQEVGPPSILTQKK